MSHPKRNVQRKLPRLVKYGIIASAICALVAVVLVALWSQQPLAQSALQEKQSEQVAESASLAPNESLTSDEAMPELSMKSRRDEGEMDESEGEREAPEVDNEVPSQQSSSLQQFDVADSGEQGPRIPAGQGESSKPTETHLTKASTYNGDLRDLPYVKPAKQEQPEREGPVPNPIGSPDSNTSSAEIPLAPIGPSAPAPAPLTTFDGLDYATWGAGHPPDTNGDVGSTYYIQTVNTSIGIYNKATSTRVAAFTFNTFMSQGSFGNLCDTDNYGDPVVMYDSFEDRWIISDFAFTVDASGNVINPPGSFQCIAVSRSGDPVTGGWYFYSINTTGGLGDYPKFGVWPDGIYMSANMFDYAAAGTFQNARVYAFNKAQMYAGIANPQVVTFNAPSTEFTLLPANARLQTGTPPAGSPNYFAVVWQYLNRVSVYKFHVDWNSISSSTFTGPFDSTTTTWWAQFSRGGATTAPTPANALDTLYPRLMMQNQYTNIGGVESLWATHTAGAGNPTSNTTSAQAAVRYYQVRITGGTVEATANQAYTYSPDTTMYRFMPSVAIDRLGDLAIGYTTANTTTNPALKYAGRLYTDTLNTISQSEQTLYQGTGSQSGNCGGAACIRWGDYSAMTLDPDGCTFWYTNEYYTTTGLNDLTRIGSFRYPSCAPVSGSGAVTGTVIDAGSGNPLSGAAVVMGSRITTTNASGVYQFTNLPAGVYPNVTASYLGYTTGFAGPITITAGLTTTQNLALNPAPTSDCFVDTTQADFQTGVATNCDLNSSPGNVTLLNAPFLDQQNTNLTTYVGFNNTAWAGQTFQSPYTGQLVQVDLYLYCDVCTGTPPNITVSIRNTTGNLPTGADLATATVSNFTTSSDGFLSAVFAAPPTLTAGTRYAIILRAASAYTNGTLYYTRSTGSVYANGRQVTSANSGGTWAGAANDIGFKTYMRTGYATSGNFVSGVKDANPAAGYAPR
ncbi:MAG TPA: carboxypeptidase-like regulatory domain-containing protein, partial [Anaerolineae bacterium]|nr:carboxypeptidase-like regulatory domain-containing protein [Anaerolineae bacterium]